MAGVVNFSIKKPLDFYDFTISVCPSLKVLKCNKAVEISSKVVLLP